MTVPAAEPVVTETPPAAAPDVSPAPDDKEREAAIARGDIIVEPQSEPLSPEILAQIAKEPGEPPAGEVKKDDYIPKPRFNEVMEENKRLKQEVETLKAAPVESATAPSGAQVADLESKVLELQRTLIDLQTDISVGTATDEDVQQYEKIQLEVNRLNRQIIKLEQNAEQSVEKAQATLQSSMDTVAKQGYALYPFLDSASATADTDAINAVIGYRNELMQSGVSAVEALQQAIDEKGPKFAKLLGVVTPPEGDRVRQERERKAKEAASRASIGQPAALPNRAEKDTFAVDVSSMTPAMIAAMPEEQKARLRGDVV